MLYLFLLACAGEKIATTDTAAPTAADTSQDTSPPEVEPVEPVLTAVGSVGVGALDTSFAGYSFAAVADGFAWTATAEGVVYVCSSTAIGDVADICEARWTGQEWSIDKIARDGDRLSVADALGSGIAYTVPDNSTGALADVYATRVDGAYPDGYAGASLHIDADGDGDADDLATTTSLNGSIGWNASPDYYGEIAVFLDATEGVWAWGEADYLLPACADGGVIAWGPTQLVTDGAMLYAGCPAASYGEGAVEGWALPLTSRPADWQVLGPSGWYLTPRTYDGVFADGRRDGVIYTIQPDGEWRALSLPSEDALDGAAPSLLRTSSGRVLLAYGAQPQTSSGLMPDDGGDQYGTVTVCDVSQGWYSRLCAEVATPDDGYATCTGAVQALLEIDGVVYVGSSGWVYGSGDGCGATTWRVDLSGP